MLVQFKKLKVVWNQIYEILLHVKFHGFGSRLEPLDHLTWNDLSCSGLLSQSKYSSEHGWMHMQQNPPQICSFRNLQVSNDKTTYYAHSERGLSILNHGMSECLISCFWLGFWASQQGFMTATMCAKYGHEILLIVLYACLFLMIIFHAQLFFTFLQVSCCFVIVKWYLVFNYEESKKLH